MKVFTLFIFLFLVSLSTIYSQVLLDENFSYTAGDSLGAHGWTSFSGGATNVLTVTSPGLTYTNYPLSGIGNAVTVRNTGQDAYTSATGNDSTGNLYVSMMVRIDTARTGDYFFALLPSTSTTLYTARLYAKDSLGMVSFGISKSASTQGSIVYSAPLFQRGTTYLVIVKYEFKTGNNTDDEASIFVFTDPLIPPVEPPPTAGPVTSTATDASNLRRVAIRQGTTASSPTLVLDGIRVYKDWTKIISVHSISSIADNFSLSQNYPNPFNPSTKIEFSIAKNSFVTLKVFDILGREVMNLINENINAGSYSVDMNAENLTGGVYLYKLVTRGFTETKKMVLIK